MTYNPISMNGSSCRNSPISIFTYLLRILQSTYVGSIYRKYEASYWLYNNIWQNCNSILSPGLSICLGVIPNELDEPGKPLSDVSDPTDSFIVFQVNIHWAQRRAIIAVGKNLTVIKVVKGLVPVPFEECLTIVMFQAADLNSVRDRVPILVNTVRDDLLPPSRQLFATKN